MNTSDTSSGVGRYVGVDRGPDSEVAFDPELDREVLIERSDAADADGVAALRRKSRSLATVVHPSITRVHDVVLGDDGGARVVVERPQGVALARWAEARPDLTRRLAVLLAIAEGIVAAHGAGVVHGSLDAAAIVVDRGDSPRITGFLRRATGGAPSDDRRAFCRIALELVADDLRRTRAARHRGLLALLRQGVQVGDEPPLSAIVTRVAASRRGPRRLELGLALAVAGGVAWLGVRPDAAAVRWCDEVERRLDAVWNDDAREALRASLLATGVDYAEQTARTVDRDLDAFAERWRALQLVRCSTDAPDPAVAVCLYRKFDGLRTVVATLQQSDAQSIAHAVDAVAALGSPDECTEGAAAVLAIAAGAAVSEEIRADLVAAEALHEFGRYADARDAARRAMAAAFREGSTAALAEAQYLLARALFALGEEAEADRMYHEAFTTGLSVGHDAVVARAAAELTSSLARRGALEEANMWRDHAIAAAARVQEPRLKARVAAVAARVVFEQSDYRDAIDAYGRALELALETEPQDVAAVLHARQGLAISHGRLGDHVEALALLRRNADDTEARYGADHPDVGRETNSVASELVALGRTTEAVATRRRAVEVLRRALGPKHPDTLAVRASLASDLSQAGERESSIVALVELVADAEAQLGRDDPRTIGHLAQLGMAEAILDRTDDAIVHLRDAAARAEAALGPDHMEVLGILNNLAATMMFADRNEEAWEIFEQVIERTDRKLGPDHPQLVPALMGASRTQRALGARERAIALLERARGILEVHVERPDRIARVDFDLAELLWETPADRPRALELARAAHQEFVRSAGQGLASSSEAAETVTAWLATHRQ